MPMNKDHKAVVLGANYYIGLSLIRCLGREGINVVAVDYSKKGTYGFSSKYISEKIIMPHYKNEEEAFLQALIHYAKKQKFPPVLFPSADQYVEFIDAHLDVLRQYFLINQTEQGLFTRTMEKDSLDVMAQEYGIKVPKTFPDTEENLIQKVEKEIGYPCLVKPSDSTEFVKTFRRKLFEVHTREELKATLQKSKDKNLEVIVQELVPGFDDHMYTFDAYLNQDAKVTHWLTGHKLRQYPINYGASVYTMQEYTQELYDIGAPFLEYIGFKGFAEIEFKKHAVTGEYYLIEINVRTTNFNALIEEVGLNMPLIAYKELTGQDIGTKSIKKNTGKVFWYVYEDLHAARQYVKTGQLTWKEILSSYKKEKVFAVWAADDPAPAYAYAKLIGKKVMKKIF